MRVKLGVTAATAGRITVATGGVGAETVCITIGFTVTNLLSETVPATPIQLIEYVVLTAGITSSEPETALEPDQPPEAEQAEAELEFQTNKTLLPAVMVKGVAERLTVGKG